MISRRGTARAACPPGMGRAASRILIVGGDPAICSLIGRALAAAGYVTDVAGTGTEGLRRVAEPGYELVIVGLLTADLAGEPVAFPAHCLDQVEAEFGSQAAHAHIHDVRSRVEVVSPYRAHDSSNTSGNFCFEVTLGYRRCERPGVTGVSI